MAPTTPPADWPTADLIRVVKGYETGVGLIQDRTAMRDIAGSYRLLGGGLLVPGTGDVIETWEEMAAVPVPAYRATQIPAGAAYGGRIEAAPGPGPARPGRVA